MNLRRSLTSPVWWVPLLLAVMMSISFPASKASAWSYEIASPLASVGRLEITGPMVAAVGSKPLTLEAGALTVHASPAVSGPQSVYVQVTLQRIGFNGWEDVATTDLHQGHVTPETPWTSAPWRISTTRPAGLFEVTTYRFTYTVQWMDDASSRYITAARIVPSSYADVSCLAAGCNSSTAGVII